jgi:putative nucleotidyltransferase with HDIG domain
MFKKIRSNSLYRFVFRVISVFILSSTAWIFLIKYYYSFQISSQLEQEIQKHKEKIQLLYDLSPKDVEKRIKSLDKNGSIEYMEFYDEKKKLLYRYEKQSDIKRLKEFIKRIKDSSFESDRELIPSPDENLYLYYQSFINFKNEKIYYKILVKLDDKTKEIIRNDVHETLWILVITTFILFISIFPIVYSQHKSMIKKQKQLINSNINTLISLGNAIAKRDSDTNEHNYRVTYYSLKIAQEMKLDDEKIKALIKGAFLHDVGKIAIRDNILLKTSKLTPEEFEIMKTHVNEGIDIVRNDPWLEDAQRVIQNHHERVDGKGYPNGRKGEDIPIEARIFAVADVFDALTSKRPYKEAFPLDKSIDIIREGSGTHFDEKVVREFESIYEIVYENVHDKEHTVLKDIFYENLKPYFFNGKD